MFKFEEQSDGIKIIGYEKALITEVQKTGKIIIPDMINGEPVVTIGKYAFKNFFPEFELKLGKNVLRVCYGAFMGSKITKLTLNESLDRIYGSAFRYTLIKELKTFSKLRRIGKEAFAYCRMLSAIELSEGLEYIESGAFNSTALLCVDIPESIKYVQPYSFRRDFESKTSKLRYIYFKSKCYAHKYIDDLPDTLIMYASSSVDETMLHNNNIVKSPYNSTEIDKKILSSVSENAKDLLINT